MKFKLTTETKSWLGRTLYRIEALVDFSIVKAGEKGGFVEKEGNLSQVSGDAWVYGNAQVYGNARVYGNAQVSGNARVYGDARVSPINIIGLGYSVTISDDHMIIGCEHHLISDWRTFDDRRIIQMDGARAAKFWKAHGQYLLALCADRPGINAEVAA